MGGGRILRRKDGNRAMAGLSIGSMQTKTIRVHNLDKFSQIGLFGGATITSDDVETTPGFKEKVQLVNGDEAHLNSSRCCFRMKNR